MLIYHQCQETFPPVLLVCLLGCFSRLYFKSLVLKTNCVWPFKARLHPRLFPSTLRACQKPKIHPFFFFFFQHVVAVY